MMSIFMKGKTHTPFHNKKIFLSIAHTWFGGSCFADYCKPKCCISTHPLNNTSWVN